MEWYIPITIIPGIGFIITATSNILLHLNDEISGLEKDDGIHCSLIIKDKLKQLKLLSISVSFQYLGVLIFLISGVSKALIHIKSLSEDLLYTGVMMIIAAIFLLLIHSVKAITIRQKHLKI